MAKVGSKKVKVDQFTSAVEEVLNEYDTYVSGTVIKRAVHTTAEETAKEISNLAPKKTGAYAKSITSGYPTTKRRQYTETVYAESPKYRLTHLLEKGHAKRNGGRVSPQPHWAKGESGISAKLKRNIEELL